MRAYSGGPDWAQRSGCISSEADRLGPGRTTPQPSWTSVSAGPDHGQSRAETEAALGRLSRPAAPSRDWKRKAISQAALESAGK